MNPLGLLAPFKWALLSSHPSATLLRILSIGVLQWYLGAVVWVVGIFFIMGLPLRNLDNAISNFVISKPAPGPFLAKITRLWKFRKVARGDFHSALITAHRTYGRVVQIGPHEYSIDDPSAIESIYRGQGGGFQKADWYSCCTPPETEAHSLFSVRNRDRHRHIRKLLAPYYRKEVVQRYEPFLEPCLKELRIILDEAAISQQEVDLANLMHLYAFDAIGRITTGNSFGGLRGDETPKKFLGALKIALRYFSVMGDFSEWHPCFFAIVPYLGALNGLRVVNQFIQDQINARLQNGPRKGLETDMMSDFMPYALSEPKPETTFGRLRHLGETNILPGADTTATAMCAALLYLSRSPASGEKLRTELLEFREDQTSKDGHQQSLHSLPYLNAVVKEAMRLHPPVGLMNPRVVPESGATIADHYFPAGSIVGTNAFTLHHNPDVWGLDHDAFRPERWLENEIESRGLDQAFFAWGAGSRECIGKDIALLQIYRTIEFLMVRYTFDIKEDGVE